MSSLQFTERMAGHILTGPKMAGAWPYTSSEYVACEQAPQNIEFSFVLTVLIDDIDAFINDPTLTAKIAGDISCSLFGAEPRPASGTFNLFVKPSDDPSINEAKEMHYNLRFTDSAGKNFHLRGHKQINKENGLQAWKETTTLYAVLWQGDQQNLPPAELFAAGVLHISPGDFLHQLTTFKSDAPSNEDKLLALQKFISCFAKNLWEAYAPFVFTTTGARWNEHLYPIHTNLGVTSGEKITHMLDTADGLTLQLHQFSTGASQDVVLLLHGLTTSTDMFIMPEHQNIVNELHGSGFQQIWSLDWRGSGRLTYNLGTNFYSMDHVARYDIPAAVEHIRRTCGQETRIHVIAHCVGSLSLFCSIAAGFTKGLTSIIANSVTLHPRVRWQARIKGIFGPWVMQHVLGYPYISPRMPYMPGFRFGKWIYWMERSIRKECKEPACHMISFMWGWGFPAAFLHENLNPITHRRLVDLFGGVSFGYYTQLRRMLNAGEAIPTNHQEENFNLPQSYFQNMQQQDWPPMLLVSGDKNLIFPQSNKTTAEALKAMRPNAQVEYREFTNYGHQDVFMGKNVHKDVFPTFIKFLKQFTKDTLK